MFAHGWPLQQRVTSTQALQRTETEIEQQHARRESLQQQFVQHQTRCEQQHARLSDLEQELCELQYLLVDKQAQNKEDGLTCTEVWWLQGGSPDTVLCRPFPPTGQCGNTATSCGRLSAREHSILQATQRAGCALLGRARMPLTTHLLHTALRLHCSLTTTIRHS